MEDFYKWLLNLFADSLYKYIVSSEACRAHPFLVPLFLLPYLPYNLPSIHFLRPTEFN